MLWASWSPSQTFAQSMSHSYIFSVINSVSPAASQAVRFIDSFMHSVHQLVSDQTSQQIETVLIQTQMSQCWLDSARLAAHLELLAASWPLDVSILPWLCAVADSAWTSHNWNTLLSLSLFRLPEKKKQRKITEGSSGAFHKDCLCSTCGFFLCLGFMGPCWVLLVGAFIVLISRDPSNSLRFVCCLREENEDRNQMQKWKRK